MAASLNRVEIIGALGRDPEVRTTQSGLKIVNLSVATSESWNDKNSGERKELTEWHRISILNERLADVAEKYLKKGSRLYISGRLQTRKWTDQSSVERYTPEITLGKFNGELILLSSKNEGDRPTEHDHAKQNGYQPSPGIDDEIPF